MVTIFKSSMSVDWKKLAARLRCQHSKELLSPAHKLLPADGLSLHPADLTLVFSMEEKQMLISYHLPIIDLRPLLLDDSGKLRRPEWPAPSLKNSFVRGFGNIHLRNLGGDTFFGGGSKVCKAKSVLRFISSDPGVQLSDGSYIKINCKFRRFYFFRTLSGKFEVGISEKAGLSPPNNPIAIDSFWNELSNLSVSIRYPHPPDCGSAMNNQNMRTPRHNITCTLGNCGPELAQAYLYASTSSQKNVITKDWWIKSSPPVFFAEINAEDNFSLPHHIQHLDCSDTDVDIYKYINTSLQTVNYIIVRNNHKKARAKSRSLRIALSDQYCYLSSLIELLDSIEPNRINPISGSEQACLIEKHLEEETKFLDVLISEGKRLQVGDGDKIAIPLDFAEAQALSTRIQNWNAAPPGFLRSFLRKVIPAIEISLSPPNITISV